MKFDTCSLLRCAPLLFYILATFITNGALGGEVSGKIKINVQSEDGSTSPSNDSSGAVVYVTGFDEPRPANRPDFIIDQKEKKFVPRVLAVRTGDSVRFTNSDQVYHNTWSLSPTKPFDLGQYKNPEQKTVTFDKPGLVAIFCNVHPQMMATVLVLKNNKYTVTGPSGEYKIEGIPSGHYELRVWTEGVTPTSKNIDVTATSKLVQDFTVRAKPRSVRHMNKDGKPYEKYD